MTTKNKDTYTVMTVLCLRMQAHRKDLFIVLRLVRFWILVDSGIARAMFSSSKILILALYKKKIPLQIKLAVHAWSTRC